MNPPTLVPTPAPAALVAYAMGQADIIVVGSVARFTIGKMTIRVDEYLRGLLTASTLEVTFPIHGTDCRENPRLDEGDRVLLFLHPADQESTALVDERKLLTDNAILLIEGESIRSATNQQSFGRFADARALIGQTGPAHRPRAGAGSMIVLGGLLVLGMVGLAVYGRTQRHRSHEQH